MNNLFVLILTPYKVGSCYMSKILHDNNIPHARLHSYDENERLKYPTYMITHMITMERDQQSLYISAYFADIDKFGSYPYSYGNTENATIQELVEHYFKQDWTRYRWLNYDYYRAWTRWFKNRNIPTLMLQTETLSTTIQQVLPEFLGIVNLKIDPEPSHVGRDAPNGSLYIKLMDAITQEYNRQAT